MEFLQRSLLCHPLGSVLHGLLPHVLRVWSVSFAGPHAASNA